MKEKKRTKFDQLLSVSIWSLAMAMFIILPISYYNEFTDDKPPIVQNEYSIEAIKFTENPHSPWLGKDQPREFADVFYKDTQSGETYNESFRKEDIIIGDSINLKHKDNETYKTQLTLTKDKYIDLFYPQ